MFKDAKELDDAIREYQCKAYIEQSYADDQVISGVDGIKELLNGRKYHEHIHKSVEYGQVARWLKELKELRNMRMSSVTSKPEGSTEKHFEK